MLVTAIERASSLDTSSVAAALASMTLREFYATISYDEQNIIQNPRVVLQKTGIGVGVPYAYVGPPQITDAELRFPTPTWAARRCKVLGPGMPVGAWVPDMDNIPEECSGHGVCDDDGACKCNQGFAGGVCEFELPVVMPRPSSMQVRAQVLLAGASCIDENTLASDRGTRLCRAELLSPSERVQIERQTRQFNNEDSTMRSRRFEHTAGGPAVEVLDRSVLVISSCMFFNNTHVGSSSGIILVERSELNLTMSRLASNVHSGLGPGSAGIFVKSHSRLAATQSDFYGNAMAIVGEGDAAGQMDGGFAVGWFRAAAIVCEDSTAFIAECRFTANVGGSAVFVAAKSRLVFVRSVVTDNTGLTSHWDELHRASSSGIVVADAAVATVELSAFIGNSGYYTGAILVLDRLTQVSVVDTVFFSNRGISRTHAAGAVAAGGESVLNLSNCIFDNNLATAPNAAGAGLALHATIILSDSHIHNNRIQGNPDASAGSGGVYSEYSLVNMLNCTYSQNHDVGQVENEGIDALVLHTDTGLYAKAVYSLSPQEIVVRDTTFEDFDDLLTAVTNPGSSRGRLRGGCEEYPCEMGSSCDFINSSLACTPCAAQLVSYDGIRCVACPPGTQPSASRASCEPCQGNTYSSYGVCLQCEGALNNDRTECTPCQGHLTPNPAGGCKCEPGRYNILDGIITCHQRHYEPDLFVNSEDYAVAKDMLLSSADATTVSELLCTPCPSCVDCTLANHPPRIRAGFSLSKQSIADGDLHTSGRDVAVFRCRPEISGSAVVRDQLVAYEQDAGSQVQDLEVQCLGSSSDTLQDNVTYGCSVGHTGTLCGTCASDFGRLHGNQCQLCSEAITFDKVGKSIVTVAICVVLMGVAMVSLSIWVGDAYSSDLGERQGPAVPVDESQSTENPLAGAHTVNPTGTQDSDAFIRNMFVRADADGSGSIDRAEVMTIAGSLGLVLRPKELDAAMTMMDADGDGEITFEQFQWWWSENRSTVLFQKLQLK